MSKVIQHGIFTVSPNDLAAVLNALPEHIKETRAEPGCVDFRVIQRQEDVTVFEVYEEFTDREAFAAHQKRTGKSDWVKVSANAIRNYFVSGLGSELRSGGGMAACRTVLGDKSTSR